MTTKEILATSKQRSNFIRSVGLLVSGNALAHAFTAVATPFLSRLYSPGDFSALAVFSGLMSLFSAAACLRFDLAVTIPDNDTDAMNILTLALSSAGAVSVLIAIPSLLMPDKIARKLNQPILQSYLWLLPPGILLAASYSALQSWFLRKKQFGLIAGSRVSQSVGGASAQVGFGLAHAAPFGLLIGYIINSGAACVVLGCNLLIEQKQVLQTISLARIRAMATAHYRFPKYSTLEALSNTAAIQLPIIMIAAVAAGPEAGYLTMAMYVMQAPVALVGTAIGQVYLSRAPDEHRIGRLGQFTAEIFGGLLKVGVGPLLFVGIVSPVLFPVVFGKPWARAGQLVSWMTPWFVMQFIAYPISMALHVTGNQRTALLLQISGLVIRVGTVWFVGVVAANWIAEAYALSGFLIYLLYVALVLRAVSYRTMELTRHLTQSLPHIVAWTLIALGITMGSEAILKAFF